VSSLPHSDDWRGLIRARGDDRRGFLREFRAQKTFPLCRSCPRHLIAGDEWERVEGRRNRAARRIDRLKASPDTIVRAEDRGAHVVGYVAAFRSRSSHAIRSSEMPYFRIRQERCSRTSRRTLELAANRRNRARSKFKSRWHGCVREARPVAGKARAGRRHQHRYDGCKGVRHPPLQREQERLGVLIGDVVNGDVLALVLAARASIRLPFSTESDPREWADFSNRAAQAAVQ